MHEELHLAPIQSQKKSSQMLTDIIMTRTPVKVKSGSLAVPYVNGAHLLGHQKRTCGSQMDILRETENPGGLA